MTYNNFNTKPMQPNPIKVLEYRNGLYQGEVKANKRHGQGILITDDNLIIVSSWKNDVMSGKGLVFFSPEHYGFGEFNRGEIEGGFLFRGRNKTLFGQFNMSRPINKLLYINYETEKVQSLVHKTPIFEVLNEKPLSSSSNQTSQLLSCLNIKFPCYSLLQFLSAEMCQQSQQQFALREPIGKPSNNFKMKSLNNGNILFYFNDDTNPTCIGFCLNKNEQLVSCGMYVADKLTGLGCKYENGVRYEGMFEGGFVNGIGLKYSQGKYTFGEYDNGNLTQAFYIDDRSNVSEQKLQQLKKLYHLRSIWHQNSYIRRNLVRFKGVNELVFEINSQQEYMYPQISNLINSSRKQNSIIQGSNNLQSQLAQINRSNSKNLNNSNQNINGSGSKNLALNMMMKREGDRLETKSSREFIGRGTNLADSNVRNQGKTVGYVAPNLNTKTAYEHDEYYKNPEDDDSLIDDGRSSSGLRNLRKFNYGNFK